MLFRDLHYSVHLFHLVLCVLGIADSHIDLELLNYCTAKQPRRLLKHWSAVCATFTGLVHDLSSPEAKVFMPA